MFFSSTIWKVKIRHFQRWASTITGTGLRLANFPLLRKTLLIVPIVAGGSGIILGGSSGVAYLAINGRTKTLPPWRKGEHQDNCDVKKPATFSTAIIPGLEVEEFLSRSFAENASLTIQGQTYMTTADFLNFISGGGDRGNNTPKDLDSDVSMVTTTFDNQIPQRGDVPRRWKNSPHLFRDLKNEGIITFQDFVLLFYILTNPPDYFKPIFKVLTGERTLLAAEEFEYLKAAISPKPQKTKQVQTSRNFIQTWKASGLYAASCHGFKRIATSVVDDQGNVSLHKSETSAGGPTTSSLSLHLFGPKQRDTIRFVDFKAFANNVQEEAVEVEFNELAREKDFLNLYDFVRWMFRYTDKR